MACNGKFTLLNGSVIFVVTGYIQFAVNIVIPGIFTVFFALTKEKTKTLNVHKIENNPNYL